MLPFGPEMGDGIVSSTSQNLQSLSIANGRTHAAKTIVIYPQYFWSHLETHSYEPIDLQVWDELIRQLSTPNGLPGDLKLDVAANPDPVRPGEQLLITFTVANKGTNDLSGVELRMVTPSYVQWWEVSDAVPLPDGANSTYVYPGEGEAWTLGTLPAGQSRTVVVSPQVYSGSSMPADGTLIPMTAMVVAGNGASAAASASVVVDNTPVVRLALDADRDPVGSGESLSYTLTYANPANVSAPSTVLRARVPQNTTFLSATDGGVVNGSWVEWSLGTVGAGQNGQRHFTVQVAGGLASGTELLGQAEIFDSAAPQDNARAEAATVVTAAAPLSLQLAASPDPVRPGEQVNLVMTVANRSGADLAGVKLWLVTPSYVQWWEVSDAVPLPDGANSTYVYPGEGEAWTLGTLPAGQSRTVVVLERLGAATANGSLIQNEAVAFHSSLGYSSSAQLTTRVGNTRPVLAAITNQFVNPGSTISFTATASDRDVPAVQTLSYSLPVGSSLSATINSTSGLFSWATSPAQTPGVYSFSIRVTDNGTPALSDEKSFTITVIGPAAPFKLTSPTVTAGKFSFTWITQAGTNYQAQYKTNLNDPAWLNLGPQILGDGTPASVTNAVGSASRRFFRVVQLP